MAPIDPARVHLVGAALSWHGRAMVLAWGVLVPLGIIAARYFKVTPGQDWPRRLDNPGWWVAHRWLQYGALGLMGIGLAMILIAGPSPSVTSWVGFHRGVGWVVLSLALVQLLSAFLRGTKGGPTKPAPDGSIYQRSEPMRKLSDLSRPIGVGKFARISATELEEIFRLISGMDDLVADLHQYKQRWIEAEASEYQTAFAELPLMLNKVREFVLQVTGRPEAGSLSMQVVHRFLGLSRQESDQ